MPISIFSRIYRESSLKIHYSCDQCDGEFTEKRNLDDHIRSKHEGVFYKCEYCEKSFSHGSTLRGHLRLNHKDGKKNETTKEPRSKKPRKCELCDKTFLRPSHLKRHFDSIHLGAKYRCDLENCGKLFTQKDRLQSHVAKIHSEINKS